MEHRVSRHNVSQHRLGEARMAALFSATAGVALTGDPVVAASPPVPQFFRHDVDQGVFGQVTGRSPQDAAPRALI
jgi:hypothetical protein